jgi:hypothetical protein
MNIIDKIKNSSSKEMAEILHKHFIVNECSEGTRSLCKYENNNCKDCIQKWLESGEILLKICDE